MTPRERFDQFLAPKIKELKELAHEQGINMLVMAGFDTDEKKHTIATMAALSKANGIQPELWAAYHLKNATPETAEMVLDVLLATNPVPEAPAHAVS